MRYIKKGRLVSRPVSRPPMEKRLEKQACAVANSTASLLYREYGTVAKTGLISFEDFRQQAFVGVMDAYGRFNPSRGVDFKTFAGVRARGEILSMLRERVPMVYVPRGVLKKISSAEAFEESISRLYSIALNAKTHGEYNSAMKKIVELRSAKNGIRPLSGHEPAESSGKGGARLFDLVESKERHANPRKRAEASDLHEYLPQAFDRYLDERTARVLKLRYLSKEHMPMRAIAEIFEVSPQMVSRIHNDGLLRLLNNPEFKRAIGLPKEKVFSRKDIGAITKRLARSLA